MPVAGMEVQGNDDDEDDGSGTDGVRRLNPPKLPLPLV